MNTFNWSAHAQSGSKLKRFSFIGSGLYALIKDVHLKLYYRDQSKLNVASNGASFARFM